MRVEQPSDFTINKFGYNYETDLQCGITSVECPHCSTLMLCLVTPSDGRNTLYSRYIVEDPRFPGELSFLCPKCKKLVPVRTGEEDDNPFVEDNMMIYSIEEWD